MHPRLSELVSNAGLSGDSPDSSNSNASSDISTVIQGATDQIQQLQTVTQSNSDSIAANTDALSNSSGSQAGSTGSSLLSSVSNSAGVLLSGGGLPGGLLGGGGLIGDAISGIASLFGGGGSSQPDFTQYQAPLSQNFELATSGGTVGDDVDSETGQPRVAPVTEMGLSGVQSLSGSSAGSPGTSSGGTGSNQQVTVNIQAMDSQSFMDRSTDIAQAVRSAMLNMNSINDVVSDL